MHPLRILFAAPHRLGFLAGTINLVGLASWWMLQLLHLYHGVTAVPDTEIPPALLHGPAMLYLIFPPFIFGFLLTVFPRWMSLPDLEAKAFGPVSGFQFVGGVTAQIGLWNGQDMALLAGLLLVVLGWGFALVVLADVMRRNAAAGRARSWHGWSAWAALAFGAAGLLAAIGFLWNGDPLWLAVANRAGIGLFLLPVFLTVAHRMVPFFAGNVVADYVRWRPDWLLAALWVLLLARVAGEIGALDSVAFAANIGLALVTALMCWKWWPRAAAPGLLRVLIWGFAWAPIGFLLSALALPGPIGLTLGRAPEHALLIGFACSMLIAMVTRVTQGHSGRPLAMTTPAWIAFVAVQFAAVSRVAAGVLDENGWLLAVAAAGFLIGLIPWAARNAAIYLTPRSDGKAG